ncbi:hypothetical protein [Actinoplanes sp. NPDC049118]|uniref:WXG100 family type VII secretion target n=1 Tax=Actinoplanes sp. NPDC049118 TaxID=3155769 RepID=UPI0034089A87
MSDGIFVPSGATPWSAYNTPRIWAMVEGEDDPESWRQVAALGSMAGLLKDQRARLEAAKQQLMDVWPPGENKASAAFVELIDNLLFTMQKNKETADANAAALGRVLDELRQAKADIAPLYQSYLEKSDDWMPGWWDNAEEELDDQARARMRESERVIAQPDNAITPPGLYEFTPGEFVSRPVNGADDIGGGGRLSAPGRGADGAVDFPIPHDPPPTLPASGSATSSDALPRPSVEPGPSSGPDLAGVITPPTGTVPAAPPVAPTVPGGSPPAQTSPGLVIGGGLPGGFAGQTARAVNGGLTPFGTGPQRGSGGSVSGRGSLGRGGSPATKPVTPSWLPPASGQPTRGVTGAGRRPGVSPVLPAAGGRAPGKGQDENVTFDPDNPWVTAEGVAPVIEPSRKRHRHDPGPGVIGRHG